MMNLFQSVKAAVTHKRVLISRVIFIAIATEFLLTHYNHLTDPVSLGWEYFAGTALIVLGTVIRCWSAGILKKVQRLVQEGPYALARNPLYIGSFMIACGFGFYLADLWYWIGMLAVFIFIYPSTIKHEETILQEHFPTDWASYSQTTGMFWPKKINWVKVRYPWSFQLWLKNNEHKTLFLVVLGLVAKMIQTIIF